MNEKNTDSQAVQKFLMSRYELVAASGTWKGLELFHRNNKYLLMALDPKSQKIMGRIIANKQGIPLAEAIDEYRSLLKVASDNSFQKGRLINMCLHVFGYFRNNLTNKQKSDFLELLESYENGNSGIEPVIARLHQLTLVHDQTYLAQQTIFEFF